MQITISIHVSGGCIVNVWLTVVHRVSWVWVVIVAVHSSTVNSVLELVEHVLLMLPLVRIIVTVSIDTSHASNTHVMTSLGICSCAMNNWHCVSGRSGHSRGMWIIMSNLGDLIRMLLRDWHVVHGIMSWNVGLCH